MARGNPWTRSCLLLACLICVQRSEAQKNLCDLEDIGTIAPGDFVPKFSLTHVWQGATGGVNTKNADRIIGLYDFDFYYLFSANQHPNNLGDYALVNFSSQMAFGNGLNEKVGGGIFNINEAAKGDQDYYIDKLFVEFTLNDRLLTFDVGKFELIDFFDTNRVANCEKSQFLATPLYTNVAIPVPSKGLGIRAKYQPGSLWYLQAAIVDAQASKRETGFRTTFHDEDYFISVVEYGLKPNFGGLPGTYRFIAWYDPQDKSYLDESIEAKRDDLGFAVSFDQDINKKTTLFFRYGWADDKVNEIEDFISFGGQVKGLFEGRPDDVFAVGYAGGLRSQEGVSENSERQIDLVETYYNIKVNKNLYLSPHLQFVFDPGDLTSESPATVLGLRCRYKF